jgi:hypothetical protein
MAYGGTDPKRTAAISGSLSLRRHSMLSGTRLSYGGELDFTLRPQARLETLLALSMDFTPHGPRWVEDSGTLAPIFGELDAYFLSLTLRQQLVLTPKLVYTREQTELPTLNGERAPMTLLPQRLLRGSATDGLLVKWSYWWG